jgi:hypothetical protein
LVLMLIRNDDDVADGQADHIFDETRYALSYAANRQAERVFIGSISGYNQMRQRMHT